MARKAIYDENAIDRIPVCLKFDKEDVFYTEFVVPLRQNRELSSFIIKLLRTYYEKETVSKAIDDALEEDSPFAAIRESIEKIAEMNVTNHMAISSMKGALNMGKSVLNETQKPMEESKPQSAVVAGFENTVGFEVAPEIEKALLENKPIEEIIQQVQVVEEQKVDSQNTIPIEIEERFQKIENKLSTVDTINNKIDMLLMNFGKASFTDNIAESKVEDVIVETEQEKVDVEVPNKVDIIIGTEEKVIEETDSSEDVEIDLDEEIEENNASMSMDDIMAQAMAMSQKKANKTKTETIVIEQPKPRVPKAFSKLADSI